MNSLSNEQRNTTLHFGRYTVLKLLGEGGMGRVYLAEDPVLQRLLAIKAITLDIHLDQRTRTEYLSRFSFEARASAVLNHPGIVTVYDAGEENGLPWIAFEFVDGERLDERIRREGTLSVNNALSMTRGIASALALAHSRSVIHRDIKPGNILIDKHTSSAKLTDFGIAKVPWSGVTQQGMTVGSPGYMSPEQINGDELDERSDLFSLGVVLYEMLSGKNPFLRGTVESTIFATLTENYPPLSSSVTSRTPGIETLVRACLTADRLNRIASAALLVEKLDTLMGQSPSADTTGNPTEKTSLPTVSNGTVRQVVTRLQKAASLTARFVHRTLPPSRRQSIARGIRRIIRAAWRGFAWMAHEAWRFMRDKGFPMIRRLIKHACRLSWILLKQTVRLIMPLLRPAGKVIAHNRTYIIGAALVILLPVATVIHVTRRSQTAELHKLMHAAGTDIEKALPAACELARLGDKRPLENILADISRLIEQDSLAKAASLAAALASCEAAGVRGDLLAGTIALKRRAWAEADRLFCNVNEKGGRRALKHERESLLGLLAPVLEAGKAPSELVGLAARTLDAANHKSVTGWLSDTNYWLRWNAVAIRNAAGYDVDMVLIYILDLEHSASMRTRVKAASRLGELGDKRAIPALNEVRKKNAPDPITAAAAGSALSKIRKQEKE